MTVRLRLVAALACALSLVAITAITFAARSSSEPPADSASPFRGSLMPRGFPAPDFSLRDERGSPISMRDLRGRVVLVAFLYTTCEDSCPLEAQQVRLALEELGEDAARVAAIGVAVDPSRDTPERARRFLLEQRVTGLMRFVLGSASELAPVWRGFGVSPQTEDSEHQARITVVDTRGDQRVGFPTSRAQPADIAHDVRVLLRERE
ncbi:SCO family protein [Svornostia abyssi]|uniref:SCO family protein n=1 Tax=Svornostia abyssi TaxID=2898438 RepID=A0ABY5PH69_9ACTN|nr:SCO family protein [Parviterribacteraceae bacterium J379]